MKKIIITIFIIVSVLSLYYFYASQRSNVALKENFEVVETVVVADQQTGNLKDITGGISSGVVSAGYGKEKYNLLAEFENLPKLDTGYFYEGWVVRPGSNLSVISTGKIIGAENLFESKKDLTDHTFYVLTLEPDDGNPAPAEHILEGNLGY